MKNTGDLALKCYKSNNAALLITNLAEYVLLDFQSFMGDDWAVFDSTYRLLNDAIQACEKRSDEVCEALDKKQRGPWISTLIMCIDRARDAVSAMDMYAEEHQHEIPE